MTSREPNINTVNALSFRKPRLHLSKLIAAIAPALIIMTGCEAASSDPEPGKLMQCEVPATGETFSYLSDNVVIEPHGVVITETDGSVRRVSAGEFRDIRCKEVALLLPRRAS